MQSQLKGEFHRKSITFYDKANIYLEEYRKAFNVKYNVKATKLELEYREIDLNDAEINELLSIRYLS